jgi:hypothetical protein
MTFFGKTWFLVFLFFYPFSTTGFSGAESAGAAGSFLLTGEPAGLFTTPLSLGDINYFTSGISFNNRYMIPGLSSSMGVLAFPLNDKFVSAIGISRFGSSLYALDHISVAGYKKFSEKWSAAVRIDYLLESFGNGYGSQSRVSGTIAMMFPLTKNIDAAFQLSDPVGYTIREKPLSAIDNRAVEAGLKTSLGNVMMALSIKKNNEQPLDIILGMVYRLNSKFSLRSGLSTGVEAFAFGFGYDRSSLNITVSSSYHLTLGFSPSVSLNWKLKKSNK